MKGELGLANSSEPSSLEYEASIIVTEPLVQRIVAQDHQPPDAVDVRSAISHAREKKNEVLKECEETVKNCLYYIHTEIYSKINCQIKIVRFKL